MANTVKDFAAPDGPILLLSAKGLTTEGIAEANGVKDFSGNENHGVGLNGVTVEKSNGYDGFGFPNNNSYIKLSDKKDTIFTQTSAYTFSVTFVITSKPTRSNGILVMWSYSSPVIQIWLTSDYKLRITADNNFTEYNSSLLIEVNTIYTITVSANYTTGHREVWANGSLYHIIDKAGKELTLNIGHLILGNHSTTTGYNLPGYIIDARIYPRALTQNEIKYLHNGFQPNIIVGQNILSDIRVGNLDAKKIYAGSNLIYAKTTSYSGRPPVGTIKQIAPAGTATSATYAIANALYMRHGTLKKLVIGDYGTTYIKIYDLDGTRSSGTYTDFDYSTSNIDIAMAIAEDDEGYIYITGANTGYIMKLQVCSRVVNGQTNYYLEKLASMRLGSLVAANQVTYCRARNALIVIGWSSGGGRSHCFQISKDFNSVINIANWGMPSMGGCFTLDGKRLFLSLYSSNNRFGYIDFSSASDTATKTSYTYADVPTGYSPNINWGGNDARYATAGTDGYMYFQMLNGSVLKYTTDGQYVAKIGDTGSTPTSGSYSTPRHDGVCTYDEYENALVYPKADGTICRMYL